MSSIQSPPEDAPAKRGYDIDKSGSAGLHARSGWRSWPRKRKVKIIGLSLMLLLFIVAIGVTLGVVLSRSHREEQKPSGEQPPSQPPSQPGGNDTSTTGGPKEVWKPQKGTAWQIVLHDALKDTSAAVPVYDIDLFSNNASTIDTLHRLGRKIICYFSAGSYENYRPDSSEFTKNDYGKPLQGWENEWWINTRSENVRRLMRARLDLAVRKGCDGVDPDNIDGYDNDTGLNLTQDDGVDYMHFLADEAHSRNLALGLKNGGAIVKRVLDKMEWELNEQCVQYEECEMFRPFIDAGKPVFHIEYPKDASTMDKAKLDSICGNADSRGFSTLVKKKDLTEWYKSCPQYS